MRNATVAGIAGAIGGALVAWLVASRVAEPRDSVELSAVLRELRESIVHLRASLDAGSPARATLATTDPRAGPPLPPREAGPSMAPEAPPDPRSTPPASPTRAAGRTALPAPDRGAVAEMSAWPAEETSIGESDPAREKGVRRRWLFATQDEVLAAFGAPDEVTGTADEERWHYRQFKGEERAVDVVLVFWNGRLRRVW
jgi:hypothetical protein